MTLYIISQIMYVMGVCVDTVCKALKSQKMIVFFTAFSSVFYILSYIFLRSPLAAIVNSILLVRAIIYIYLSRGNKPFKNYLWVIVTVMLAVSVVYVFYWSGPLDLLMFFGVLFSTLALACRNTLFLRLGLIISAILWSAFNGMLHAYVNMSMDLTNLVIVVVAIFVYNVPHKERKLNICINEQNEKMTTMQ